MKVYQNYETKPAKIQAAELTSSKVRQAEIIEWAASLGTKIRTWLDGSLIIPTLEGDMKAVIGDFIIKGTHDEFYPCKPEIFHTKYRNIEQELKRKAEELRENASWDNWRDSLIK